MADQMTRCLHIIWSAVFFVALILLPPAIVVAAGGLSSEVDFVELYAKIIREVDTGALDRSIGKKARSLNSKLQQEINGTDSRLEELKADSMKLKGSERDALLDELIASGAKKERIYLDYRRQLEQLVDPSRLNGSAMTSTGQTPVDESQKAESHEEGSPESRSRTVKFESVPEDVTTGEFD